MAREVTAAEATEVIGDRRAMAAIAEVRTVHPVKAAGIPLEETAVIPPAVDTPQAEDILPAEVVDTPQAAVADTREVDIGSQKLMQTK
jgi:hypothetical protein